MTDFNRSAATSLRLVEANGRLVTLVELEHDAQDDELEWRSTADPRETPYSTLSARAAFVPLGSGLGFKKTTIDLAKKAAASCLLGGSTDYSIYQELIDESNGHRYKIDVVDVLKPADVIVLTAMVLNR